MSTSCSSSGTIIPLDEVKKLLLDLVSDLDGFCREKGIRYALAYGSLIGAIRHKGIIPWDDDIDLWMPRPDFLRLLQEYALAHPDSHYEFQCMETDPEFPLNFAKFCDTRTESVDQFGNRSAIAVDIFILDGLGQSLPEAEEFIRKVKRMQRIWSNQRFTRRLKLSRQYNLKKNSYIFFAKAVSPFISFRRLVRDYILLKRSHPIEESRYCANLNADFAIYETSKMLEYTDAPFEGRIFRIPAQYDHLLRTLYGDYMQMPPEGQRVVAHGSTAFWIRK